MVKCHESRVHASICANRRLQLSGASVSGMEVHDSIHVLQVREKAFREMKKDVGMTTAQKSKETRRMEMGSIFVLYIQPTIPTYTYITTL